MPQLSLFNKYILSFATSILFLSCTSQQNNPSTQPTAPGTLVEYTFIDTLGTAKISWTINEGLDLFMTNGTMKASDISESLAKPHHGVKNKG